MEKTEGVNISLDAARKIAYTVDRYLVGVLAVLEALKGCLVTFDAENVMSEVSLRAWSGADGEGEHFELVAEAREALKSFLDTVDGKKVYKVYPFFAGHNDGITHGLKSVVNTSIWYVDDKAYKKIRDRVAGFKDVGAYVAPPAASGLLAAEERALVAVHCRHVLGAINALRDLSTGWAYVERHIDRGYGKSSYGMVLAPEFSELAVKLRTLLELPSFPPVANGYFSGGGTSSEAVNTLKSLTAAQVDVLLAL